MASILRHDERLTQEGERLRIGVERLQREVEDLQEASPVTRVTYEQRFQAIATFGRRLDVRRACAAMRVRRSSYYAWLARGKTYRHRAQVPPDKP
ncbi:MAG: hypothetical protein NTX53_07445 [candidate division WOR-3 bacterium]|nr:hypothetical protein [candidate division WOR-3 bacterium]